MPSSTTHHSHRVLILGSGCAGLTAAIYAARADLAPILFEGPQPGGQLTITTEVENFPGFPEGVTGPELIERMKKQATRFGTTFVQDQIKEVRLSTTPFEIVCQEQTYVGRTVIIATGASANFLGLPSEKQLMGRGVSACATCDGFFFKDKDIVVVGGGDTALEEALFLTRFGKSVTVLHRRDSLRASKFMQERARQHPKIRFHLDSVIDEVLDVKKGAVEGVLVRNVKSTKTSRLDCQGLFIAVGHTPNTQLFKGQIELSPTGYLITKPGKTATEIPGVFAAGDVADHVYRQAITAAGSGCMAAIEAERFLKDE